ncbi:MAG: hypothetical protein NVSMB51_18850 [Solirubrobacteraceae bacterium]
MTPDPHAVLPRGRHAAPRHVVEHSQRVRLYGAMAEAVAEKGYGATSVADVLARAGVSRKNFYELFANKQECFLAAAQAGTDALLAAIEHATEWGADRRAAAATATAAYLAWLDEHPAFARTYLVDALAAGPEVGELLSGTHQRFADLFAHGYEEARRADPSLPELGAHRFRAVVGAVNELVELHLRRHGPGTLAELHPLLLDVELALLLGAGAEPQS